MAELKYEKYFIKGHASPPVRATGDRFGGMDTPKLHHVLGLNSRRIEGAIMMNCSWVLAGEDPGKMDAHVHPYPEVIGFIGTNPDDLNELGAEAEIWMEDEKYTFTETFLVYVPEGVRHCPLIVRDIKRPILHFDLQLTTGDFTAAPTG